MNGVPKIRSFLLALAIIIGLIFLNFPSVANKIKNFFYSFSTPVQERFDDFIRQVETSWEFLNHLKDISKRNIRLGQEIKELIAQNVELKELKKENELLRSYLDLPVFQRHRIDLANVTGRDFQGLEKYILINKGSSTGIEKNMPVIAFRNILVGRVIEVFDDFSKILLITSSNSKVPVLIQGYRIEGLMEGLGENFLFMNLVPKDKKVEKGQTIVTSGIGGIFPKGLLVGEISKVESPENEMFQRIEVVSTVEMEKLERVFVIKK